MKKIAEKIVNEVKDNLKNEVRNNAATQLVASEKRERLAAQKKDTPREIWAKWEKENALLVAAKVVEKCNVGYSFDDAKQGTNNFTLLLTTSENETKTFAVIGAKTIYSKDIEPNCVDNVLRSFESYKLFHDAKRIQADRMKRAEEKKEKTIATMQETPELLLAAAAAALGVSVEQLRALQGK